MIKVNDEMLRLYLDLGHDIVVRQMDSVWGSGFFKNLSLKRYFCTSLRELRGTKQPKQSIENQQSGLLRLTARNDDCDF